MTRVARLQYVAFTVAAVFTAFLPSRCRAAGSTTSPAEWMQNDILGFLRGDHYAMGRLSATSVEWKNRVKEFELCAYPRGRARFRELLRHVQEGEKEYILRHQQGGLMQEKKPEQHSGVLFSRSLLSDWNAFRCALKFLHKNVGPSTGHLLEEGIEDAPSASLIATLWQEVTRADLRTATAYPKSVTAALLALENGLGGGRLVGVPKASEEPGTRSAAFASSHDEDRGPQQRRRSPRSRSSSSRSSSPRTGGTQGRASGLRRERVRSRRGGARTGGEDESPAGSTSTAASALEQRLPAATVCEQYVDPSTRTQARGPKMKSRCPHIHPLGSPTDEAHMVYWGEDEGDEGVDSDAGARSVLQLYSALKARETFQAVVKNAGELVFPDIESGRSSSRTFPLVCSEWYAGGLKLLLYVHLFRLPAKARMGKPTQDKSSVRILSYF